ncbi:DHA2 family efflux MFS transporter permease subunit [Bradyrhizobium erythrophlei]|uniref:Drug resistance transporter, EmrB/QacA subfamily n=1 Tax=Bradyrhizobium erythrophlei TaxID=1437360 RepID=A0A1M7T001_9BRAD|nr:DHA2 family efflux MFS transporter permease subunit [Bradyrhizobium erythrophlei]SHN63977.1 drug resistance transporter, EmrB/QacA subfamily [Bradyrhizobium erythrophlei]
MTSTDEDQREAAPASPHLWRISSVAILGAFLSQMDATVVNVSLSSLALELDTTLSGIQWVTSGYLLALALTLPLSGWLVDRMGAKALYLWCFAAFTLTSALCGLAWSANSLIGFRILQGMSGGLLAPMAQLIMVRAAGDRMARVFGFAAMPILLAPLLGPVIAGELLHFASWRWLFLVNLPFGALAIVLAALFLPHDRHERRPRSLDLIGLGLLSPGVVLFLYGSERAADPFGLSALVLSALLFVVFFWWVKRKKDDAIIDLRLFKNGIFSAAVVTQFLMMGISYAGQMLVPVFLARVGGLSPSEVGLLLAAQGLGMMCTYPFVGSLVERLGNRNVSAGGALAALAGTVPFIFLVNGGPASAVVAVALFVRGMGLSCIGIPTISAAYASVNREDLPMATTALNIVMRVGGPALTTLCAAFLGWRLAAQTATPASNAYGAAFALLCAFHLVLCAAAMRLPRKGRRPEA